MVGTRNSGCVDYNDLDTVTRLLVAGHTELDTVTRLLVSGRTELDKVRRLLVPQSRNHIVSTAELMAACSELVATLMM